MFLFGKVLHSCCAAHALPKKGTRDVLPLTAEGRTATQQLPSFSFSFGKVLHSCCAAHELSKKHGLRSHSPRKGQRPRSRCLAAAKGVLGESGSQSRRFYRDRRGWGCADGRETRNIRNCRTFSTCLPTSCGSPPPPLPPSLPPVHQAPSPAAVALGPSTSTTTARPWWSQSA
jgi:hypothetical protein